MGERSYTLDAYVSDSLLKIIAKKSDGTPLVVTIRVLFIGFEGCAGITSIYRYGKSWSPIKKAENCCVAALYFIF
jgi:hypothetical protein